MGRATSDPALRKAVLERVSEESIDFVLLWFTDIVGQLKSFAVTVDELDGALDDGMGFDGSSITGFNSIEGRTWSPFRILAPSRSCPGAPASSRSRA